MSPKLPNRTSGAVLSVILEKGIVVIFAAGTGNPYMTTDTAAALRAIEMEAEVVLKATHHVDGIYNTDPQKDRSAKKFDRLTLTEALHMRVGVIDATALSLCRENKLPIIVFDFRTKDSIERVVMVNHWYYRVRRIKMINNQNISAAEIKMKKTIEVIQKELTTIRTGHASPALIEHLKIIMPVRFCRLISSAASMRRSEFAGGTALGQKQHFQYQNLSRNPNWA